jgi:hypothetical protein
MAILLPSLHSQQLKRAELLFFIWIKGGANFEPTTPVHKKRVLMRLIFLSLGAFMEKDYIPFKFNSPLTFLGL